jgi:hypothetical protein
VGADDGGVEMPVVTSTSMKRPQYRDVLCVEGGEGGLRGRLGRQAAAGVWGGLALFAVEEVSQSLIDRACSIDDVTRSRGKRAAR